MKLKNNILSMVFLSTSVAMSTSSLASSIISDESFYKEKEALEKKAQIEEKRSAALEQEVKVLMSKIELQKLQREIENKESYDEQIESLKSEVFEKIKALESSKQESGGGVLAIDNPTKANGEKGFSKPIYEHKATESEIALETLSDFYMSSVYGLEGNLKSIVMFQGGRTVVGAGSRLPNNWKVKKVNSSYITVTHDEVKGERQISFKSPSMIASEIMIKQEEERTRSSNRLEIEKIKAQNEMLPTVDTVN